MWYSLGVGITSPSNAGLPSLEEVRRKSPERNLYVGLNFCGFFSQFALEKNGRSLSKFVAQEYPDLHLFILQGIFCDSP